MDIALASTNSHPGLPAGRAAAPEAPPERQRSGREPAALMDSLPASGNRVLIVEDDPVQAKYICQTLETAGYQAQVCDDPWRFAAELAAWRPDLVLMDVLLPGASGYELLRSLRQIAGAAALPVLFLTAERRQSRRALAWAEGDDHLVKPLAPAALLAAVSERLVRNRCVRQLVARDPITLSLTSSELLLRAGAAVAQQQSDPRRRVVWAAVELDHLWSIHECYGESTDDRVLAAMAATLRRHLRPADCLGRAEGARLALLLDDLSPRQALKMIDGVRLEFAAKGHLTPGNSTFRTTFSAGIAGLAPGMTVEQWREAAERALRIARAAGRNRVELIR